MLNYHQKMITPYRLSLALHSNVNIFNRNTKNIPTSKNRIGGVMVSMLTSSAVDCELEHWSGQGKDDKIGICCCSAKQTALRSKNKDWLE